MEIKIHLSFEDIDTPNFIKCVWFSSGNPSPPVIQTIAEFSRHRNTKLFYDKTFNFSFLQPVLPTLASVPAPFLSAVVM